MPRYFLLNKMSWWKNKQLRPALLFLGGIVFLALARDILANGRPLYCRIKGETFFPGLRAIWTDKDRPYQHPVLDHIQQNFLWRLYEYDAAVFAPIPFSPGEVPIGLDTTLKQARPGAIHPTPNRRFRHWLGTDNDGYDVAAGVVGGARIAVLTGAIAMCLAFGIGITLGAIAGFWGDNRLRIRRGQLWMIFLSLPIAWFYCFAFKQSFPDSGNLWIIWGGPLLIIISIVLVFSFLGKILLRSSWLAKPVVFPADLVIMRLAEVFTSLPGLMVIIAFAAMLDDQVQTLWPMIILIGIFSWAEVARFVRGELLRVREQDYVTAARGMGLNEWRILLRHALPNALRTTLTVFAFGVGSAIMLEAGLSFLGYGDQNLHGATWGSLLQNARSSPQLWWICLPPGLAIALTVLALNTVGEALSERR